MKTESLEYSDGDVTLRGFLAYDDRKSGRRPGVLVMPEAFGLGAQAKRRAERLAELGYVALAGDPYGDGLQLNDLQEAIKRPPCSRTRRSLARGRARRWTSWPRCRRSIRAVSPRSAIAWAVLYR
jgi:dienelactone hydrolase